MPEKLNTAQGFVLSYLDNHGAKSAHDVAHEMSQQEREDGRLLFSYHVGYDRAHAILKRLEGRGLVERLKVGSSSARWHITAAGREALRAKADAS